MDHNISELPFSERVKTMLRSQEMGMRYLGVVALVEEFKGREELLEKLIDSGIARYEEPHVLYPTSQKRPSVPFTKEYCIVVGLSGIFLGDPEWEEH